MNIKQIPSPNFVVGRGSQKPEIIVIHIMAGTLIGTDSHFSSPFSQVSTHYGIGFNGEVHQYVKEEDTAWGNGLRVPQ
jgi:N-acetylmuramoyl-L-alanine amidase